MSLIRTATLKDVEIIIQLWKEMMKYHSEMSPLFYLAEDSEKYYRMYLVNSLNNPEVLYTVSENDGFPSGYARGSIVNRAPIFEKRRIGMINEIFVLPQFRNSGLGSELTKSLTKWFNTKGIEYIELEVAWENKAGIEFWKRLGFTNFKIKMSRENDK